MKKTWNTRVKAEALAGGLVCASVGLAVIPDGVTLPHELIAQQAYVKASNIGSSDLFG